MHFPIDDVLFHSAVIRPQVEKLSEIGSRIFMFLGPNFQERVPQISYTVSQITLSSNTRESLTAIGWGTSELRVEKEKEEEGKERKEKEGRKKQRKKEGHIRRLQH